MQVQNATVDGTPLRWLEQSGSGVPVVLVHGLPTSPALWRHVTPHLPGRRLLAFEMTGYGESIPAGKGRDLSLSAQADRLLAWLQHLDVPRAVLAGHDLGGGVVHIAAVRRPEACAGLLVCDGVGYDAFPIPSVKAVQTMWPVVSRLPAAALAPGLAGAMARGHDDLAVARESFGVHFRPYAEHGGGAALARQTRPLDVRDTLSVQDALPTLDVPARIVWGARDPFLPVRVGERFARDLRAPLRRIEGGRHFTPEDSPEIVAQEVEALLSDVGPSGR